LEYPGLTFSYSNNDEINLIQLISGRIDLWPVDKYVGLYLAKQKNVLDGIAYLPKEINNSKLYLAFARKPGYDRLAADFSRVLTRIKQDGALDALLKKYTE